MKILIVEDDYSTQRVFQKMLQNYGECDIATNGEEAVKTFNQSMSEGNPYDLICLDIMMPVMSGQEVLKTIIGLMEEDKIPFSKRPKVIMTTALSDSKNVLEAFKEQCDGYLTKPYEKVKIHELFKNLELVE